MNRSRISIVVFEGNKSEIFVGVIERTSPDIEQVRAKEGEVHEILAKGELENCEKGLIVYVSVFPIRLPIVKVKFEEVL